MAELFDSGYAYRTINAYRSAISAYHCELEGKPIGQHKQVCSLLKGVFTKKPPQPRYAYTWDVQVVLDFIKNKWGNSMALSDKDLTFKLVTMLALTSASRACTIHCLDIRFMAKHAHYIQFKFGKLHKSWKTGKSSPMVTYFAYEADEELCVKTTIEIYLNRTEQWRHNQKNQLLLSYVNPHKEVCSSTISGWIKKVLSLAGIDTNVFKGHSSRSAASSRAELAGASISEILSMGSWSNESVWQKYYNKPVLTPEESFQKKLLSNN